jgi:hypothetical protein
VTRQRDRWDRRDRSIARLGPSRPVSARPAPHSATRRAEDARPRRWPGHNTPLFARETREGFLRLRSARVSGRRGSREGVRVRVASRRAHCPPARARRIFHSRAFAGHLSERAREARATRRSETRVKRARGLERVFVRSFTGETRVERARARGERGESSVGGVQWFRGGPS